MSCGTEFAPLCPSCGQENPAGARFCMGCGAELDGAAALGNGKVVGVDVLDGLQGLDDPAWQRAVSVFDVGWDYHSP